MRFPAPCHSTIASTILMAGAIAGCGTTPFTQADLQVKVVDARTGSAIANALVEADYGQRRTNGVGQVRFQLRPDTYDLSVEHPAYLPLTTTVVLYAGGLVSKTVSLYPRPTDPASPGPGPDPSLPPGASPRPTPPPGPTTERAVLFGRVGDDRGGRLANATVFVESSWGIALGSQSTNGVGEYRIERLPKGQPLKVLAFKDGYKSVGRTVVVKGEWRLDFTGGYALRREPSPAPDPGGPPTIVVSGRVEDTMGRAIDGVIIKAESENVRYPFSEMAIARDGRFTLSVLGRLPIRFTASKVAHRTISFVETLESSNDVRVNFTGQRALDPTPILEGN